MATFEIEDDDVETGSAADNPALLAMAAKVAGENAPPILQAPLDGPVTLPGGFLRLSLKEGETKRVEVRKAWVRELNGADEERISKARLRGDMPAFVDAILRAGVETFEGEVPTKDDFDRLSIGDRDYLLMEISRVTYGDDLDYVDFGCPNCGRLISFTVHKGTDIPIKRLDKVSDNEFEVRLRNDRVASVRLPTHEASEAIMSAETEAESNTAAIAAGVTEIRNKDGAVTPIAGDLDEARKLSVRDRQTLVQEMSNRMPGPQYNEVRFEHSGDDGCGKEIRLAVTLADLFLGL